MPPEVKVKLSVEGTPEALAAFRAVQEAAGKTAQATQAMQAGFGRIPNVMRGIVGLAGALGLATTAVAVVQQAMQTIRDGAKLLEKLGVAAEREGTKLRTLVPLALEAKAAGIELETLQSRMGKLAGRLVELKQKSPEAEALFAKLRLSARDFKGQDLAQHFEKVMRALGGLEDGYRKTVLMQAIFGRGGEELTQMANNLARNGIGPLKQKIADLFDERQVAGLRNLEDQLSLLDVAAKAIAIGLPAQLLTGLDAQVRGIAVAMVELAQAANEVNQAMPLLSWAFSAFGKISVGTFRLALEGLRHLAKTTRLDIEEVLAVGTMIKRGELDLISATQKVSSDRREEEDREHERRIREIWANPLGPESPTVQPRSLGPATLDLPEITTRAGAAAAAGAMGRQQQAYKLLLETWEKKDKALYEQGLLSLREYFRSRSEIIDLGLFDELEAIRAEQERIKSLPVVTPEVAAARERGFQDRYDALNAEADALVRRKDLTDRQRAAEEKRLADASSALLRERELLARQETISPEKRSDRLAELDERITEARRRAARDREALHGDEVAEEQDLQKKRLDFERQLANIQKGQHAQRLDEIREQRREYEKVLSRGVGLPGFPATAAAVTARGEAFELGLGALENFEQRLRELNELKDEFSRKGYVTPAERAELAALVMNLREMAASLGPKQRDELKQTADVISGLTGETSEWLDALRGGFTSFFGSTINGFRSVREAALGFLLVLAQIAQQIAAQRLMKLFFKVPGKAAGGRIEKRAGGGRIYGGGTWTSDSVPILASRDEQMTRAAIASLFGVRPYLELLNAGEPAAVHHAQLFTAGHRLATGGRVVRLREWGTGEQLQRLAAGGQVRGASGAGGGEFTGALTLNLPPGVTLGPDSNAIYRDRAGREWVLGIVINNRRTLRQFGA